MNTIIKEFPLNDIVIPMEFTRTPPNKKKVRKYEDMYLATEELPGEIVLNEDSVLIDGYITYLIAKVYGYHAVPVVIDYIELIHVRFKPGKKVYTWRVPRQLQGRLKVGDSVLVYSNYRRQVAEVERVEHVKYGRKDLKDILQIVRR